MDELKLDGSDPQVVVFGQEALLDDCEAVAESEHRAAPSNCEDCD